MAAHRLLPNYLNILYINSPVMRNRAHGAIFNGVNGVMAAYQPQRNSSWRHARNIA